MRIGIIVENFRPHSGGLEQWSYQFARWLANSGHELHVFSKSFSREVLELGIVPHAVPSRLSKLGFAAEVSQLIHDWNLDVTHDMGFSWGCDIVQPHGGSREAAFRRNVEIRPRLLRSVYRRLWPKLPRHREFREIMDRQYRASPSLVIALSNMVARDLSHDYGVPHERIRLIYNGVDTERFSPRNTQDLRAEARRKLGISDDTLALLVVAQNHRLKGVPELLRAVGVLSGKGLPVHLAVVGGKKVRSSPIGNSQSNASNSVLFVGQADDPLPFYSAADVYVHPTHYDPCSLVVLEALACGLPVVTTRYNGVGELIEDGRQGYVIDEPGNLAAMCGSLRQLFDVKRREKMSAAACELAKAHSLDHNFQQVFEVYREVNQRKKRQKTSLGNRAA